MLKKLRSLFINGLIISCFISVPIIVNYAFSANADLFKHQKVVITQHEPFVQGIRSATGFLYLGAYKLHEHLLPNAQIVEALEEAAQHSDLKEKVLVILESNLTPEEQKAGVKTANEGGSLQSYKNLGIQVVRGSPAFNATHFKILVSDPYAFIGTTNFDKDFEEDSLITRDFSLIFTQPKIIKELKSVFENDIHHKQSTFKDFKVKDIKLGETRLTWGPNHHRQHLEQLINNASESIEIYQQALQDEALTDLLVDAIKRGVKVSILMSQFPFGEKHGNKSEQDQLKIIEASANNPENKSEVRLTGQQIEEGPLKGKKLHIHAKVMIIDGGNPQKAIMYLGSANFYTPALDKDRNVGVITRDQDYIQPVRHQFLQDWAAHTK